MAILYGLQSSGEITPILVDSLGRPIISISTFPETTFDAIYQILTNTSLPAGVSNQLGTAVPTSQAYVLKTIAVAYTGTITGVKLRLIVLRGATVYQFNSVETVVSSATYGFAVDVPMIDGDQAGVRVVGATLNDDITLWMTFRRIR